MTLLLTGYEPFGGDDENPSEMVTKKLDGAEIAGHEVVGKILPVEFGTAAGKMQDHIETHDPDAIVATGLAAGRAGITVERVGINVNDSGSTPDNAGVEPRNERIHENDRAAYFATLPVVPAVESLLDAGIPASVSNTAGTHLCNNALFSTRAYLERESLDTSMGFVHLPCTPEQAAQHARDGDGTSGASVQPSLPLSMQVDAIRRVFDETLSE